MARPENLADIQIEEVSFAVIELDKISTDGTMIKAYGAFLEAMQKAGNIIIKNDTYRGTTFYRQPSLDEQARQLKQAQDAWDSDHKHYMTWSNGEEFAHEYQYDTARRHAKENDLPQFTWDAKGTPENSDPDLVIENIDKVLADGE